MSGILRKIFKLFAYLVLVVVVFVVSITAIFVATFDANAYKQDLSDLVHQQTGRDLQFFGDIGLTVYPDLGMKLGALSLSNANGFGSQPMVKVNRVSISVDVGSLIAFSPQVSQLLLSDLEVNLQKNSKGVTNWDDLVKSGKSTASTETPSSEKAGEKTIKLQGAFGGLNIQNASLLWKDDQAGVEFRVDDLDLTTGRITPDGAFPLQLQVLVQSGSEIDAKLNLDSDVQYLLESGELRLSNLALKVDAGGSLMPFDPLNLSLASQRLTLDPAKNAVDIEGLQLGLNNLLLKGRIQVRDYTQPSVLFKLEADTLDVDEFLGIPPPDPKAEAVAEPEPVKTGSAEDVEIKLPMALLRSLEVDGSLTIAKLKLLNLWMKQIELGMTAKGGVVDLKPLKMQLYDGSFEGAIQIDAKGKLPKYQVIKDLQKVQVGKLLTDFTGKDQISGNMTAGVSVTTQGEWLSQLKKNSNGSMSLAFVDGALNGFNLRYSIDKAKAKLKGQPAPEGDVQKTDFSALSLTGKIKSGVFSSNDLDLQAPALRVGGEGQADLNNETVDYLVKAKLVKTLDGQEGGSQDELSGLLIPVRIKGPFTDPDIDVQLDEMLKAQSAAKIAAEKARLEAQIAEEKAALEVARQKEIEKQKAVLEAKKAAEKKKLEDKVKDKLNKLFD
ncbi:MAG: AsmA family protein [Gammaproteobacteria bacterium]|nr:AsmA family protein [Gammaproteobacteria bacterium]